MAETAEQSRKCEGFDRYYYETQRQLSLAPAIGSVALRSEQIPGIERRRIDEVVDGIAEALPGIVKNERCYRLENKRLVAEDGCGMEEILLNGFRHALRETAKDSFYNSFRPQRARHELDEARIWQSMANGETDFNTLVVWSPYSEEFCSDKTIAKLQAAGQAPEHKRAMLKIAHWAGGQLKVLIRSVDNSSVEIIKSATRATTGYTYSAENSTDMLGERQEYNLKASEVYELVDKLVNAADLEISSALGEETRQGRPVQEALNAQKHVQSETQIIDNLLAEGKKLATRCSSYEEYQEKWHSLLHGHTALIKERMLRQDLRPVVDVDRAAIVAGDLAAVKGESFNMCGLIISANPASETEAGVFESIKSLLGKKVTCPECKEKVVPPTDKLQAGRLCCTDCKYEVDVCTGQVYAKSNKGSSRVAGLKKVGIYEMAANAFSKEMAQIDYSIARRRWAKLETEKAKKAT